LVNAYIYIDIRSFLSMDHSSLQHPIWSPFEAPHYLNLLTPGQIVVGYMCNKVPYGQVMLYSDIFSAITAFDIIDLASSLYLVVIFGSLVIPNSFL
jgi:hypothetical protein